MKSYTNKLLVTILAAVILLTGTTSCKKYLDSAFQNPNKPVVVDPDLVFPAVISNYARGRFFDARFLGNYISYWHRTAAGITWDRMGYDPGSDNGGEKWRTHYWNLGQNLINIIRQGAASFRPAYAGAGYALFASSWLELTDYHGDVILDEAFRQDQLTFKFNAQEDVYKYIMVLCDSAIYYLNIAKTQGPTAFNTGDRFFYGGNIDRWIKFTHGVRAKMYHRYFLKSGYSADSVIKYVNLSFSSAADDALIKFDERSLFTVGFNFYGPTRANLGGYRQSDYLIRLMNGTIFTGSVDPRMAFLFKPAQDGQYRGLLANNGFIGLATIQQPSNFWGFYVTSAPAGGVDTGARTYFKNASPFPIMTYAELQFVKAEAALKKGDANTAYTAYIAGLNGSFDHLITYYTGYTAISSSARTAFLSNPAIVPASATGLTLSHIMLQKFVSLWPYGMEETWVDMRRHQYSDRVYLGYTPVASLFPDNAGKVVQRVRPRYNSEYLWNVTELAKIGALDADYHTKPVWFSLP